MAEAGEWKRKGAALSYVPAQKEYGSAPGSAAMFGF
jgi:hypothetical protein